ncbi:MAG: hypothetical protein A2233_05000 [Candidatus Kerfeldbacteria bacterium RIFOXYA2_FULL_38_24]|uniref:RNA polymerase sigma-70 region 2 domain-containing protein n=1 Tax=Candidatus Kerfeldbacteria bacterium RIFOXYB2_FULL_38_14 TaxID=1798547 RepID=A0A1G2B900_9BACT|nr:MAG: hypothetical protein A2233_05000 [Candidatus Kerfeldbacteria bacterium RIFOXYA2_FULL_38_24]OGY85683.1 MAG: hypothetical protein A2319_05270 [Candidatus Kerfeldbacteria bacterium RIFOXYB2_FULL_38_14]OGY88369.1 MAG: hypothetical protein A2458_02805 [Candidatus Kerfeldbacteria bacterium RIFOXYC2_FULL_38_9]
MGKIDTSRLVLQAKEGKQEAFSALYELHIKQVYRFIYYKVGNQEDAEDLAQEVFVAALNGLKKFQERASFRNWCYEIAKRKIADLWRQKYKMPTTDIEAVLGLATPVTDAEEEKEQEQHDAFKQKQAQQALAQLKDNYRQILEYRFLKNYSLKETAQAMNITVGNAKVLQHRALKKASALNQPLFSPKSYE